MIKRLKPRNVEIFFLYFKSALVYFHLHNLEHISVTQSKFSSFRCTKCRSVNIFQVSDAWEHFCRFVLLTNSLKNSEGKYQRKSGQMTESDGPKSDTFAVKIWGKHRMKTRSPCYVIPYTEKLPHLVRVIIW